MNTYSMKQTKGLFCTYDSGVARCQSQHKIQCHFWRMNSMYGASIIFCLSWGYARLEISKYSLKACFENVNKIVHT